MSAPRCIRLAIRACRPVKVSNPAVQSRRRSFASTSSFRDANEKNLDITAGFPEVPVSSNDIQPSSTDQVRSQTPTSVDQVQSSKVKAKKGITIEVATELVDDGDSGKKIDKSLTGRQLIIGNLPAGGSLASKKTQLQELFSAYEVESIKLGKGVPTTITLKSAKDVQSAISELSGKSLSTRKSTKQERSQVEPEKLTEESIQRVSDIQTSETNTIPVASEAIPPVHTQPQSVETKTIEPQNIQSLDADIPPPTNNNEKVVKAEATGVAAVAPAAKSEENPRIPLNVVAAYHKPLKIDAPLGIRVASLQLRSYSIRNLEFMCDFALRAAYFLGLPASGPVPLPKKIERWTMPRSNFVHKKSQENFERITRRRLIQIMDGHTDVVQIWLAYLRKHQFYGVGMKADVWEFEGMDVAASMDAKFHAVEKQLDEKLSMFGWNKHVAGNRSLTEQLQDMGPGQQTGVTMMHVREGSMSKSRI